MWCAAERRRHKPPHARLLPIIYSSSPPPPHTTTCAHSRTGQELSIHLCKSWVRIPGMAENFSVNIGWKRRRGRYIMDRPGEDPFPQSLALGKSLSPHARLRDFPETLRQRRRNQTAKRRETGRTPAAAHITRLTKDLSRANYKVTSNNRQHTHHPSKHHPSKLQSHL